MSEQVFAFDQYKRARQTRYTRHLADLTCPHDPGLVSIVLPCFNAADYVREALDHILGQTYAHYELIAINDGSTDDTGAILDAYARQDARIQVIHQNNQKVPRTLSRGFRLARGEFYTWVSADNRLKPDFLARLVTSLQEHPDWDMVYGNMDIIDPAGNLLEQSREYPNYQMPPGSGHIYFPSDLSTLNTSHCYIGAAFLYRSRVAWLLGDYSPYRFTVEDYDYWMQVNDFFTLRHADHLPPVYDYRYHGQSLTAQAREHGYLRLIDDALIWDEFRRDVALMPACWLIDGRGLSTHGRVFVAALKECIRRAGHRLLTSLDEVSQAGRWTPTIYVRMTGESGISVAAVEAPAHTLKVLVSTGADDLPAQIPAGWDICAAVGDYAALPRLEDPYQGWMAARKIETLFTALDIRAKCEHLRRIETETFAPQPEKFRCSVIVSAQRQEIDLLPQVMSAVATQDLEADSVETILVVDDPSHEGISRMLDSLRQSDTPPFRVVTGLLPGLVHARNLAAIEARSPILCYVDSASLVQPGWLSGVVAHFDANPDVALIGGPSSEHPLSGCDLPANGAWSVRREALLKIGGFRTAYSHLNGIAWAAEACSATCLIQRRGGQTADLPEAATQPVAARSQQQAAARQRNNIRCEALLAYLLRLYLSDCGQTRHPAPTPGDALRGLLRSPRPASIAAWWTHTITYSALIARILRDNRHKLRRPASCP